MREGYVAYTFGDGNPANAPTLTAGQFANPVRLSASRLHGRNPHARSARWPSARPATGIWANQDYDKGVQLELQHAAAADRLPAGRPQADGGAGQRHGPHSEDTTGMLTASTASAYQTPDKALGVGVSYYDGQVPEANLGGAGPTGTGYHNDKKQLFGADAQYFSAGGLFVLNGEYESGKYEQLYSGSQARRHRARLMRPATRSRATTARSATRSSTRPISRSAVVVY